MAKNDIVLTVFVASPADVVEERVVLEESIEELNVTLQEKGRRLDLIHWETHVHPDIGEDGQDVVNRAIGDKYDVFIGILWTRFGTPTKRAGSGTEEEFRNAYARFNADPKSLKVMLYFNTSAPASLEAIDPDQLKLVRNFRDEVQGLGALTREYSRLDELSRYFRIHLQQVVSEWGVSWGELPGETPDNAEVSTQANIDETELGFLDYLEIGFEQIAAVMAASERLTASMEEFRVSMERVTPDFAAPPQGDHSAHIRRVQVLLAKASAVFDRFVAALEADTPVFAEAYSATVDSFGKAAVLYQELNPDDVAPVSDSLSAVRTMRDGLESSLQPIASLRATFEQIPSMNAVLNRSKRRASNVLQSLEQEWLKAIEVSLDVERSITDILQPPVVGRLESVDRDDKGDVADFRPGDRVTVIQKGTLYIGGLTLTNNTFGNCEVVSKNADGSYQVRGIVNTPGSDEVTIPASWIQPA